jgi:hypothetical protein
MAKYHARSKNYNVLYFTFFSTRGLSGLRALGVQARVFCVYSKLFMTIVVTLTLHIDVV